MSFLSTLLAASLAAATAPGQAAAPVTAPAPTAEQNIAAARLPIERRTRGFAGPGWDRLVGDARNAQFLMIGEQHGSGDIARMETALHAAVASAGYTHSALEVGPFSTRFVESLIRQRPGALAAFIAAPGHGFTIPFLFFAEEITMAEQMVALSPDRTEALWGLDQEFVGAAPVLAELLERRARTVAQKAAIAEWRAAAAGDKFLVAKATVAQLGSLERAFSNDPEARAIVAEIRASRAIYDPFFNHGTIYPANLARETMMKTHFLRGFAAAEKRSGKPPKVFLKFGGYHAMRGHSGTDVPALANFLAEWGQSRGFRLVNVMVDCDGGQALDPQSGKPGPCEPYFGANTAIGKVVASGPPLQLIDLTALRPKLQRMKDVDPLTRQTILAFDYYIAIRGGAAATPVGTPAAR